MRQCSKVHLGTMEVNIKIKETKSLPKLHKWNIKDKMECKFVTMFIIKTLNNLHIGISISFIWNESFNHIYDNDKVTQMWLLQGNHS